MCVNKSSSGEIFTTFTEMGTTRSSRSTTDSKLIDETEINTTFEEMGTTRSSSSTTDSKLIDGTKTSKKGLKLKVSYLQFYFINLLYNMMNLFNEKYFTFI